MVQRLHWFEVRVLGTMSIELLTRTEREPPHKVKDFELGQDLAVLPSIQHFQNVKHPLECITHHLEGVDALRVQVPYGRR